MVVTAVVLSAVVAEAVVVVVAVVVVRMWCTSRDLAETSAWLASGRRMKRKGVATPRMLEWDSSCACVDPVLHSSLLLCLSLILPPLSSLLLSLSPLALLRCLALSFLVHQSGSSRPHGAEQSRLPWPGDPRILNRDHGWKKL